MMATDFRPENLIELMPETRGELIAGEPLAKYTWFKVGGPAEVLFKPADEIDLCNFLSNLAPEIPVNVIGNSSNLLIRDGGIEGVVIRLGRAFSSVAISGEDLRVGAAAADLTVARKARDASIAGLEFMAGIPGTVGGTVRMNGGAYGSEIKDICRTITVVDRSGNRRQIEAADAGFSYRHTELDASWIVTEAQLHGVSGDKTEITKRIEHIQVEREKSQPVRTLTGGSTFANPLGHKAWELIDKAGCRGLTRGGAGVSELHCNFLNNLGKASAADIEGLGEEVRRRVFEKTGVMLEWEIRRIGNPVTGELKEVPQ